MRVSQKSWVRSAMGMLGVQVLLLPGVRLQAQTGSPVQTISPVHVLNWDKAVPGGREKWRIADVSQSHSRWAVLLRPMQRHGGSAILTGDKHEQSVSVEVQAFDRIAMDRDHVIYLRHSGSRDVTVVSKWNAEKDEVESQSISETNAEPVVSEGRVNWKAHGSSNRHRRRLAPGEADSDIPEERFVFGLPAQRYMVFGALTEEVMTFDADGALAGMARVDLDSAYTSLGLHVPTPDFQTGRRRVVSAAASSREGLLYVQLSETLWTRPAPVAVFDPSTGRLLRVLNAVHPLADSGSLPYDGPPVGLPVLKAVDDLLVISFGMGYLAFYQP